MKLTTNTVIVTPEIPARTIPAVPAVTKKVFVLELNEQEAEALGTVFNHAGFYDAIKKVFPDTKLDYSSFEGAGFNIHAKNSEFHKALKNSYCMRVN